MDPPEEAVKRRGYDVSARRERARMQRERTLDEARRLFLERGYVATTVDVIAEHATVSSATIYKTYGGKAGLVRELCRRALAGTEDTPAEQRSNALRASRDAHAVVQGWGSLAAEVSPLISPLALLLARAAEEDEDAAALHTQLESARLERMAENARALMETGQVRPELDLDEVRDVLWLCTSAELFDLMVLRRGWTPGRFGRFVSSTIASALL